MDHGARDAEEGKATPVQPGQGQPSVLDQAAHGERRRAAPAVSVGHVLFRRDPRHVELQDRLPNAEHGERDEPHPRAVFLPRLGQLRLEHRVDAMADVRLVLSFPAFSRFTFFHGRRGRE